jgi:hypothetical protein
LRHSAASNEHVDADGEEQGIQETPGRPDRSISEYAEAYVRMMADREAGHVLAGSVITPQPEQQEGDKEPVLQSPSSQASPALSSATMVPSSSKMPYNPKLSANSREMAPLAAPSSAQQPLGFNPLRPAVSGPVAGSLSSNGHETHSRQASQSLTGQQGRGSIPPRSHRRNPSNTGHVLPKADPRSYDEDEEEAHPPMTRQRISAGAQKAKNGSRSNSSHGASPAFSSAHLPPRSGKQGWHARSGSTASTNSSNSDSPRSNSNHLRLSARDMISIPPSRGLSSSGTQIAKHQKAASTLFYIRRRIHGLRAISLLMLIAMTTVTLVSWVVLTKPLAESQRYRTHGCTTVSTVVDSDAAWSSLTTDHRCIYFRHDMTPFLAVSGIWLAASLGASMINVAAGFMFYWRNFMRMTFLVNVAIFFVTIIVLNWTITLVAFGYEDENWRYRFDDSIVGSDRPNRPGQIVKSASISLLVGISIFWFFNFCAVIVLNQLRKFVMTKPRFCCWPLEGLCCQDPLAVHPINSDRRSLRSSLASSSSQASGPFSIPSSALSPRSSASPSTAPIKHLSTSDHSDSHDYEMVRLNNSGQPGSMIDLPSDMAVDSDMVEDELGGVIITRDRPSMPSSSHPTPPRRTKRSPPQPDLTPLLTSLQGIHDTVNTLATKVQAIEQREISATAAAPSYSDPFAYGRKPPQF